MEIDVDVNFQRRAWVVQRVGWVLIAIVLGIAALGFFGTGLVSRASAQADGLRLEYDRFARFKQPTKIQFSLDAAKADIQLALSRRYLESVQIEQITPEPSKVESAGEWLIYHFAGQGPLSVTFHVKPDDFGGLSGAAQTSDGHAVVFRQFVYP
jgi:hypothetical protein